MAACRRSLAELGVLVCPDQQGMRVALERMQEHTVAGRIVRLAVFTVSEFGTRANFTIDEPGQLPVVCNQSGKT